MTYYTKNLRVITHIETDRSLEGRVNSSVNAYLWQIDEKNKKLYNPEVRKINVPIYIPTYQFSNTLIDKKTKELDNSINLLKDYMRTKYSELIEEHQEKLFEIKNKETKKAKELIKKISFLEKAIKDLDKKIDYKLIKRKNRSNFILQLPHLLTQEKKFLNNFIDEKSRFSSNNFLAKRILGGITNIIELTDIPYTKYYSNRILLKQKYFENPENHTIIINKYKKIEDYYLKNSGKLSLDIETTEWKSKLLSSLEKLLSKKELVEKYDLDSDLINQNKEQILNIAEDKKDSVRNERIVIITLSNSEKKEYTVLTVFPFEQINPKYPGSDKKIKPEMLRFKSQEEMLDYLNELYKKSDHLWGEGHNQMSFDYQKFLELVGKEFFPGIDETTPKFVPGTKFKTFKYARGRFDIDPSTYYQYNAPWTMNNRLDYVFEDVTGEFDKKIMNHSELEANIQYALNSKNPIEKRMKIINDLHSYGIIDPVKSEIICHYLMDEILKKAKIFGCSPTRLSITSRKTFIGEYWTNWSLNKKGLFLYKDPEKESLSITPELRKLKQYKMTTSEIEWNDFSLEEFQTRLINYYLKKEVKKRKKEKNDLTPFKTYKEGRYKTRLFYFNPIVKALSDFFKDNKYALQTYNLKFKDPKKQFRYYKSLEWIVEYPLFKIMQYSKEKLTKKIEECDETKERNFEAEFRLGFDNNKLSKYHDRLVNYFESIARGLSELNIVNNYRNFFFIEDNEESEKIINKLTEYHLGIDFGSVDTISIKKNVIGAKYQNQLMLFGISDPNSKQGEKNDLEKEIMTTILRNILINNNYIETLKKIRDYSNEVQLGLLDPERLNYIRVAKRHFTDYSVGATQKYIKELIKKKVRKGEEIKYKKDFDDLTSKMFGFILKNDIDNIYELTDNSVIKNLLYSTIPIEDDNIFFEEQLKMIYSDVLTGVATDEEIKQVLDNY